MSGNPIQRFLQSQEHDAPRRSELLPCPFCGAGNWAEGTDKAGDPTGLSTVKDGTQWHVYCHSCGAHGPASDICGEDDDREREQARQAWNKAPRNHSNATPPHVTAIQWRPLKDLKGALPFRGSISVLVSVPFGSWASVVNLYVSRRNYQTHNLEGLGVQLWAPMPPAVVT